jgi:hypothetical protein
LFRSGETSRAIELFPTWDWARFEPFLRGQLDELAPCFRSAATSKWLLVFGSENSNRDPDQPWLPFTLEPDF